MIDKIKIRKMTISDLDNISSILETDFDDFWNLQIFKQEIANTNSKYIVAVKEEEIVGFAGIWISVDDVHITNIVTKKDYRNNKIGKKMLEALIYLAKNTKRQSITLEVNENNKLAIKLYERSWIYKNGNSKKVL